MTPRSGHSHGTSRASRLRPHSIHEFARLRQLLHDVKPSNQLTFCVELSTAGKGVKEVSTTSRIPVIGVIILAVALTTNDSRWLDRTPRELSLSIQLITYIPRSSRKIKRVRVRQARETHHRQRYQLLGQPHLRIRWPVGELFEPLPNLVILQNIERAELDRLLPQQRDCLAAEAALRSVRVSLHEQHHATRRNGILDPFLQGNLIARQFEDIRTEIYE